MTKDCGTKWGGVHVSEKQKAADEAVTVKPVQSDAGREDFLNVPYELNRGDEGWHPPLRFERKDHLKGILSDPMLSDVRLFVAYRNGRPVGRVAAFQNRAFQEKHEPSQGHFGFFDVDPADEMSARLLMNAAEDHLRALGCKEIGGPYNSWIYDEIGTLASGFDTPNMVMMPHNATGLSDVLTEAGYEKEAKLLAYYVGLRDHYPRPPVVQKLCKSVDDDPSLRIRQVNMASFDEELQTAMAIFNDGWSVNWGHLDFPPEKVAHMGQSLKPILTPDRFWFAEADGEPVAFVVMLPNVNEAIRDLDGKLLPFGWAKLLWRLKVNTPKTSRMALMGLKRSHHKSRAGVALICSLFEAAFEEGRKRGVEGCELSWVLEQNKDVRRLISLSGAEVYKTYDVFQKSLVPSEKAEA
ncbi:MAG: hypothetical protein AAF830_00580 [Pseudomonadota bacterium]